LRSGAGGMARGGFHREGMICEEVDEKGYEG